MNLRQLTYFVAIAEHGSIHRASQVLHISQPAVSAQIKLLEEELEVQLFERRPDGVLLTPEGRDFLRHAHDILGSVDAALANMCVHRTTEVGLVSVGIPGSLTSLLTVPLVEAVQARLKNVQLRVVSGLSGHLHQWVVDGSVNFGLVYSNSFPPAPIVGLDLEPLLTEELYVAARDRDALQKVLTRAGEVPLANLAGLPLVLPGREHGLRAIIEEAAGRAGIRLTVRTELDASEQLKEMARRPGVFTVLSLAAVRNDPEDHSLFTARIIDPTIERVVLLAHASGRPLSRAARRVEQILRSIVASEIDKGWWKSARLR